MTLVFLPEKEEYLIEKLEELINQKSDILIEILNNVLNLRIKKISMEGKIEIQGISGYDFRLIKLKTTLEKQEVDMYIKMVKRCKIKESIFCYWYTINEEENEGKSNNNALQKATISELTKKKYKQSIFLGFENEKNEILEAGTEVDFLDITKYIREQGTEENKYLELLKYFQTEENEDDEVLLIGIKMSK